MHKCYIYKTDKYIFLKVTGQKINIEKLIPSSGDWFSYQSRN